MIKKSRALSQPARQIAKRERSTIVRMTMAQAKARLSKQRQFSEQPDDADIDFSDIPALTDEQLKNMKRVGPGRPPLGDLPRKMISIKLDPVLLENLKREAKKSDKPYQSLIHEILLKYMKKLTV